MCNLAHISRNLSTQLVHRKMKTWIQILLLIVSMTLGHHTTGKAYPSGQGYQKETHRELSDVQQKLSDKYQLYHETLSDQERGTALLTDSNQSTRINTPRPQRYLPPYLQHSKLKAYKKSTETWHIKLHLWRKGHKNSHSTTPISTRVPVDYYVIALRHIIR